MCTKFPVFSVYEVPVLASVVHARSMLHAVRPCTTRLRLVHCKVTVLVGQSMSALCVSSHAFPRIMSYDCKGNTRMRGLVSQRLWCFEPTVSVVSVKPRADVTTEPSASLMCWEGSGDALQSSVAILVLTSL
jgi:hypothetical protein